MKLEDYGLKYFLSVVAMVLVIEGIPYFLSPQSIKKWLSLILNMDNRSMRIFGLSSMITGLAVLYVVMRII